MFGHAGPLCGDGLQRAAVTQHLFIEELERNRMTSGWKSGSTLGAIQKNRTGCAGSRTLKLSACLKGVSDLSLHKWDFY